MRKIYINLLAIFLLGVFPLAAQNTDGTDFWVTFGGNYLTNPMYSHTALNLQIRLVSRELPATVTITYTNLGTSEIITLEPREVRTIDLNNTQKQAVYNNFTTTSTTNRSIHITSDEHITAYAMNQGDRSTDATNILPITVLGKEYYQISYMPRSGARDTYAVIATEDNTQVYHDNGATPAATLMTGQVYYRVANSGIDMTGIHVTADKPVAFFALNQGAIIPAAGNLGGDCFMQQLSPVNTWGKKFFVPVSNTNGNADRVRIVASKPNTEITHHVGGNLFTGANIPAGSQNRWTNLQPGQWVEFEVTANNNGCYIQASDRIGVCTYLKSQSSATNSTIKSDPSQAWLPAIEQTAMQAMLAPFIPVPSGSGTSNLVPPQGEHYALLITPTATKDETKVSIGGGPLIYLHEVGSFNYTWRDNTNATPNMSFCSLRLGDNSDLSYLFENSGKLLAMGYGIGKNESYYYLGFSAQRDLDVTFTLNEDDNWEDRIFCERFFTISAGIEDFEPEDLPYLTWEIDDVLIEEFTGMLEWPYPYEFSIGNHIIKMNYILDGEQREFIRTLKIGGEIAASVAPNNEWGSVIGTGCYEAGTTATLIAIPSSINYKLVNWTDKNNKVVSTQDTITILVAGDSMLVANFVRNIFDVILSAEPPEGGTVAGGGEEILFNTWITISATPNEHYVFSHWAENGVWISDEAEYTFQVTRNRDLVAFFDIETFYVYVEANPEDGGMVFGGGVNITYGDEVEVSATPFANYYFINWTNEAGDIVSTDMDYSFSVEASVTLTANFRAKDFSIVLSANPPQGGTVSGGNNHISYGTMITVSATPNSIYQFVNWTETIGDRIDTVSWNANYEFPVIRSRHLVANFELKTFDIYLNVNPPEGGTAYGGGNYIPYGAEMTVWVVPNLSYNFLNWTDEDGTIVSGDMEFTFNVTKSRTLTANFEPKSYLIRLFANPPAGGTVIGDGTFNYQEEITVSGTVNDHYHFTCWTENGDTVSFDLEYTFPVTRSRDLTANFDHNEYDIIVEANPSHGGIVDGGGYNIVFGTNVTVTAMAKPFFHFENWTEGMGGTVASVDANYTFEVTKSRHLVANFSAETFDITVWADPIEGGSVSGGGTDIPYLTEITVSAFPDPCYDFMGWAEDDEVVDTNLEYTFLVTKDRTLTAIFVMKSFNITIWADPLEGGDVSGNDTGIPCGTEVTLTATPDDCYIFLGWMENGEVITTDAIYTFEVTGDHDLVARFEQKIYNITLTANITEGGFIYGDEGDIPCGTIVTVVAIPEECYTFINWTEGGAEVSTDAFYTFTITESHNLVANFELNLFDISVSASPSEGGFAFGGYPNIPCGMEITVTAIPTDDCFTFINWTEEGNEVSTELVYTFTVAEDRVLIANFEQKTYNIIVGAEPPEGGTVSGGGYDTPCGTVVTAEVIVDECYTFINWTENGEEVSTNISYSFTAIEDRTLVAHFERKICNIVLSAEPENGGITYGNAVDIQCGEVKTITAVPMLNYIFAGWTKADGTFFSDEAEYTFPVTDSLSLIAHFVPKSYTITVEPDSWDRGTVSGGGIYWHGELCTVTATPLLSIYKFVNWTEDNDEASTHAAYTFPVTRSRDLVANFAFKSYEITLEAYPPHAGTVEVEGGGFEFEYGTSIAVIANAYEFFYFESWNENGVPVSGDPYFPFSVTGPRHLVAHFSSDTFNVTVQATPPEGGTVSGGGTNIPYLTEITVSATLDECYEFAGWIEDEDTVSTSLDYTFVVTGNHNLEALFVIKTFIVTATSNPVEGGMLSIDTTYIDCGESITITAISNLGYRFLNWTMDGVVVHEDSIYTFIVTDSTHLIANFEYVTYNIILDKYPSYAGNVFESDEYLLGYELTVHAVANIEYKFVNWTEDSVEVSTDADYSFTVYRDRLLTANFTTNTLDVELSALPDIGGTVEGGDTDIPYGEWITITATPNDYFVFVNWTEEGVHISDSAEYSFPVHYSCHLVANFEPEQCLISLTPSPATGGTLQGGGTFPIGMERTIEALPATDYTFEKWTENDSVITFNATYTFTVMGARSLVAHFTPKNYIINLSANSPEGGEVSGGGSFQYMETATILAEANENYVFVNWTEGVDTVSTSAEYTFPVTRSRNLVANFVLESYNIDLTALPPEGGWVQGAGYNIPWGTDTAVRAYPYTHYVFVDWTENNETVSDDAEYSFTIKADRYLTANFAPKNYHIAVYPDPPECGTASGGGNFPYQETATVIAQPKPGFMFVNWTEDGDTVSVNAEYAFPVLCSRNLTANFTVAAYNIILAAEPTEGGTVEGDEYDIAHGALKTVYAYSNELYNFVGWYEDDVMVSQFAEYNFIVSKSRFLVARFTKVTYPVTLISVPFDGGTLLGGGDITHGNVITISADANDCYAFVAWMEGNDTITNEPQFTVTITEPRIFLAHFEMTTVSITTDAYPPEGGTVTGEFTDIFCGTEITVSAHPKPEYNFINWTLDGEEISTTAEYTFSANFSGELVANFVINYYTITLFADPPDLGEVEGGGIFAYGTEITISAEPYEGFSFIHWLDGTTVVSTDADYTFVVKKSQTLVAYFEKTMYTIIVEVNDSLCGHATGSGRYDINEYVQVKAFEKEGYQFANWTIDGTIVSTAFFYSFPATRNLTIVANFFILDFDTYAVTLWDNTFMLNLKKLDYEGYEVTGCRWYKNGTEEIETNTIDVYSYSAGPKRTDLLELAPTYYMFQLITKEGKLLNSTKKMLLEYKFELAPPPAKLIIYPNPVFSGNSFTIEGVTAGSPIEVFNQAGVCVSKTTANDTTATLTLQLPAGIYIIRNHNKEGKITFVR